jgi:hypothetical protein
MKSFLPIVLLFFCFYSEASSLVKIYPLGEKRYKMKPLTKQELSLNLARLESAFFIIEFNEGFDFKKHSPVFDIKTDGESPFDIELHWLLGHQIGKEFIEDIVIPVKQENIFLFPKENFPSKKLLLVEVKGKEQSPVKKWAGDLKLVDLNKNQEIVIPLKVHLHNFILPSQFQMKTSFGFAPWTVYRKHKIAQTEEDDLYAKYFKLAREHRIDLHKIYLEFSKREDNILDSAVNTAHSFNNIWKEASGREDSSMQMQITDLPVPPEMKQVNKISENFWRQLDREVKRPKNFFVYYDDEPSAEQIKMMVPVLKKIKEWAPHLNFMLTSHWSRELDGLIDIWCPNLFSWNFPKYPSPKKYEELKKNNNELWTYVSCMSHGCEKKEVTGLPDLIINTRASTVFSFAWVADAVGATGILYYDTVRGYLETDFAPWRDPKIFNGLGEGNLFYPCPPNVCGTRSTVFASLRLKILRASLESLEIVKAASQKDKSIAKFKEAVARSPRSWAREINDYETVKQKALEILDAN